MNHMNVLHVHWTDIASFPIVSEAFPALSKGAYDPAAVYTADMLRSIVEGGRLRGIRVIAEWDMPGFVAHLQCLFVYLPEALQHAVRTYKGTICSTAQKNNHSIVLYRAAMQARRLVLWDARVMSNVMPERARRDIGCSLRIPDRIPH
jgi:N-acetyl-beta-hexosaminidase